MWLTPHDSCGYSDTACRPCESGRWGETRKISYGQRAFKRFLLFFMTEEVLNVCVWVNFILRIFGHKGKIAIFVKILKYFVFVKSCLILMNLRKVIFFCLRDYLAQFSKPKNNTFHKFIK